jgi:O-methyltransferase involved in polyketide biosynthesis
MLDAIFSGDTMELNKINLGDVQETLLLPLWGRAIETQKKKSLLTDKTSVSIVNSISYDFTTISKNISKLSQISWIARSIYFDKKILDFINLYPDATIVNIGCGLDTTFDRIDNGRIKWVDLDLPDTIELRKKFIKETSRRLFVSSSVFDEDWYNKIDKNTHLMFLFAGVLYYFKENEIKKLFNSFYSNFTEVEIIFDYCSVKGLEIANKKVIESGGMKTSAKLQWGINNIYDLENWGNFIKVIDDMPMFKNHKKKYPFYKRIGMNISDRIRVMSLANIKIKKNASSTL